MSICNCEVLLIKKYNCISVSSHQLESLSSAFLSCAFFSCCLSLSWTLTIPFYLANLLALFPSLAFLLLSILLWSTLPLLTKSSFALLLVLPNLFLSSGVLLSSSYSSRSLNMDLSFSDLPLFPLTFFILPSYSCYLVNSAIFANDFSLFTSWMPPINLFYFIYMSTILRL